MALVVVVVVVVSASRAAPYGGDDFPQHTIILRLFWILSGTTRVSRYQKGKTRKVKPIYGFTGARDSEWQWHLLGHMRICTSPQPAKADTRLSHPAGGMQG